MRILHIYKLFSASQGGVSRHIDGLAKELASIGFEVAVAAPVPEFVSEPYKTFSASPVKILKHIRRADIVHIHGARTAYSAWAGLIVQAVLSQPGKFRAAASRGGRGRM